MTYRILLTPQAQKMLAGIKDRRIQQKISEAVESLSHEPEKLGKLLTGELSGFYSLRAVGQRYRIIYQIHQNKLPCGKLQGIPSGKFVLQLDTPQQDCGVFRSQSKLVVLIVAIGSRKEKDRSDIYSLARKLIRLLKHGK